MTEKKWEPGDPLYPHPYYVRAADAQVPRHMFDILNEDNNVASAHRTHLVFWCDRCDAGWGDPDRLTVSDLRWNDNICSFCGGPVPRRVQHRRLEEE